MRTMTFTMEDALISAAGFMILSGAGLTEAGSGDAAIKVHTTENIELDEDHLHTSNNTKYIKLSEAPYDVELEAGEVDTREDYIYIMILDGQGEIDSEPLIGTKVSTEDNITWETEDTEKAKWIKVTARSRASDSSIPAYSVSETGSQVNRLTSNAVVLADYYVARTSNAQQIDITPDKFGGNYYLEASTLFRDTNGVDMPAEFIVPNCKIQSNFTFTMASSGDPSTFTFTMDAFPDYTRFNKKKKVLAAIQIITGGAAGHDLVRTETNHASVVTEDKDGIIHDPRQEEEDND